MAESGEACAAKGITLAVPPPKSPKTNGRAERLQATWRNRFHNVQDSASNVTEPAPLIDGYLAFLSGRRPHEALDGMTPDEFLESLRISEAPPSHMS